jgi:hypothetical protein
MSAIFCSLKFQACCLHMYFLWRHHFPPDKSEIDQDSDSDWFTHCIRHSNSPDFTGSLPKIHAISRSPDFSEYSGNIIKNYKYTVFSNIIVCLDLFWSCFMAIYRITYNNIVPICRKRHFRRLNFYYFFSLNFTSSGWNVCCIDTWLLTLLFSLQYLSESCFGNDNKFLLPNPWDVLFFIYPTLTFYSLKILFTQPSPWINEVSTFRLVMRTTNAHYEFQSKVWVSSAGPLPSALIYVGFLFYFRSKFHEMQLLVSCRHDWNVAKYRSVKIKFHWIENGVAVILCLLPKLGYRSMFRAQI